MMKQPPFMPDPLGNVNNWLFVRRIDPSPAATQLPSGISFDQQLLAAQAQQQQAAVQQQQAAAAQQQQQQQQQQAAAVAQQQTARQPLLSPPSHSGSANVLPPHVQHSPSSLTGPVPATQGDVDMANAEAIVAPIVIHNPKEPEYTRKKISDFLHSHTAYELIPESGKVVVLDVDLPVRQAFHALHEQGIASAPLWDLPSSNMIGVISASDFIHILKRLRNSVTSGGNPMSEAEMDAHTIRGLREEAGLEGREPKPLVFVKPDDDLGKVASTLSHNKCSMAPILSADPIGSEVPTVLHLATLSGVLACLMRHFRASLASLPLLAQPLGSLPLGTWSPDAGVAHADVLPDSKDRRQWRKLQPLHTVTPNTLLTTALSMLLEAGVSALPVVDDKRCLLDIYARSDITQLCKANAYNRLQWEDVTVGQALSLAASSNPMSWSSAPNQPVAGMMGGLSAEFQAQQQAQQHAMLHQLATTEGGSLHAGPGPGGKSTRVYVCSKDDPLRTVVERLAIPGVRRLVVVQPETRRVEGLISLSDVAAYLFS
eukprot:CAMPEP_0202902206 /NCGR_PEP_ID=MMETSP1392-20130828/16719_1 /ASSEMBLY_ACC=CAM_ASM_000868 /TAXON_ID=225041 /ORGANISM="Chlamydomonas chlamydogama, Strain SAG 11-48b" /LENGTH=541 /DNA_ID=CAMNT_0049588939 /DNA_START=491 /DNA_END=2115 /DNA_ORIENTATION=+